MVNPYASYFTTGTVFVTCFTAHDEAVLTSEATCRLFRETLRQVKQRVPFTMNAFTLLPEHAHLMIRPEQADQLDEIVGATLGRFNKEYQSLLGQPGKGLTWSRTYQQIVMHNVETFAAHLDYIHYDAVRHNLADRPEEWLQCSYEAWVERGIYKLGWGWQEPESIKLVNVKKIEGKK